MRFGFQKQRTARMSRLLILLSNQANRYLARVARDSFFIGIL
jgi:hypothetical protein